MVTDIVCCVLIRRDTNGVFTPEQDNDKTKVEPVHSYDAFHTRHVGPGTVHRFSICAITRRGYRGGG